MDTDAVLGLFGFKGKYEELTPDEKVTFHKMLGDVQAAQLTIDKLRDYINMMKASVEDELTRHDLNNKQDLFLKARLKNLSLIASFLDRPEKAKKTFEEALKNVR